MEARDFTVGRFQFKDFKVLGGKRLKAHGCCHLKYYGWEVCAAVLYLPEDVERPLSGSDVTDPSLPKMLDSVGWRSSDIVVVFLENNFAG